MEQEHTLANQRVASHALSLPHFDEEATLLSARPVVPLHEVKAKTGSRRRLAFGLALVAALFVGALSATLLYTNREQPGQAIAGETVEPAADPTTDSFVLSSREAGGSAIESDNPVPSVGKEDQPSTSRVSNARNPAVAKTQSPRISSSTARATRTNDTEQTEAGDPQVDDREMRRAERREARRLRREEGRERRSRREQAGDDLMRIREIFEGSPRPR